MSEIEYWDWIEYKDKTTITLPFYMVNSYETNLRLNELNHATYKGRLEDWAKVWFHIRSEKNTKSAKSKIVIVKQLS